MGGQDRGYVAAIAEEIKRSERRLIDPSASRELGVDGSFGAGTTQLPFSSTDHKGGAREGTSDRHRDTKSEKILEVGPITATKETKKTVPLSPLLGGAAVLGGIVLLAAGARRRT